MLPSLVRSKEEVCSIYIFFFCEIVMILQANLFILSILLRCFDYLYITLKSANTTYFVHKLLFCLQILILYVWKFAICALKRTRFWNFLGQLYLSWKHPCKIWIWLFSLDGLHVTWMRWWWDCFFCFFPPFFLFSRWTEISPSKSSYKNSAMGLILKFQFSLQRLLLLFYQILQNYDF